MKLPLFAKGVLYLWQQASNFICDYFFEPHKKSAYQLFFPLQHIGVNLVFIIPLKCETFFCSNRMAS